MRKPISVNEIIRLLQTPDIEIIKMSTPIQAICTHTCINSEIRIIKTKSNQ